MTKMQRRCHTCEPHPIIPIRMQPTPEEVARTLERPSHQMTFPSQKPIRNTSQVFIPSPVNYQQRHQPAAFNRSNRVRYVANVRSSLRK